jgi:hypothetical protein
MLAWSSPVMMSRRVTGDVLARLAARRRMEASLPEQGRFPACRAVMASSQLTAAVMFPDGPAWVMMNCVVKSFLRSQVRCLMSSSVAASSQ